MRPWRIAPAPTAPTGTATRPSAALLAARIRIGIGTDSVVSVGELDLLAEARAASALAGLDPTRALALCTLDGARALGLDAEIGGLRAGKWGDCVVIRRRDGAPAAPEAMVLASGPRDVLATFVGGRDVYRNSQPL